MCDEYYDARMKALWRAIAEEDAERNEDVPREEDRDLDLGKPIVIASVEPHKPKPAARVH